MENEIVAAIAVLIITVLAIYLINLSWIGSKRSYRYPFIGMMASEIALGWGYFVGINVDSLGDKLLLNNFEYLGYLGAPISLLIFALLYSGSDLAKRRNIGLMLLPIPIFELIIASNPYHHLYYTQVSISDNPMMTFDSTAGPLYYVFGAYTLIIILTAIIVLTRHYLKVPDAFKRGCGLVILTSLISLTTILSYYLFFSNEPSGMVFLIGLAIGNVPLFIGAFRFRIFEMLPFANERVLATMRGGVAVLDVGGNVLFINRSAEAISGRKLDEAYQLHVSRVFPKFPAALFSEPSHDDAHLNIVEVEGTYYELEVRTIEDHTGNVSGKLVRFRDVTEKVLGEAQVRKAENLISILNSITRHDIRNQLVTLEGHLSLMKTDDPALKRHLDASIRSAHAIEEQLEFARDYQDIGGKAPVWQSIDAIVRDIGGSLDLKDVDVRLDTRNVEILADPLLGKVFYSLIDDSLMHGEHVSTITVKVMEKEEGIDLVYEDDGIGVPDLKKEIIFEKGYGSNTGLGLFLSREILRIGDMSIIENGEAGKGARFVICVPKGRYRFPGAPGAGSQ